MHLQRWDGEICLYKAMMLWGLQPFGINSHFLGFSIFPCPVFPCPVFCRLEVVLRMKFPMDVFRETARRRHGRLPFSPSIYPSMHAVQVHFCKNKMSCKAPAMG